MSEEKKNSAAADHHRHADPDPEIRVRPLAQSWIILALVMVVTSVILWFGIRLFVPDDAAPDALTLEEGPVLELDRTRPVGPLLQPQPAVDLDELHRWEQAILDSYGWTDREQGLARVPVDEALRKVAESGLPRFATTSEDLAMETGGSP